MNIARALRLGGAILLLLGGAVHLQLEFDDYGTTGIGRAFVLNAACSAAIAASVVLRRDRLGPIAGIALSLGSLGALALTRIGEGLFNFRESGFEPAPQTIITILAEVAAALVLTVVLVLGDGRPARLAPPEPKPLTLVIHSRPPRRTPLKAESRRDPNLFGS